MGITMIKEDWKKNFFLIYFGQAISTLTTYVLQFSISWQLAAQTGSPLILNLSLLAGFLPRGILGPFVGPLIDKFYRKNLLIISDLYIALVSLALIFVKPDSNSSIAIILLVVALRSVGTSVHNPSLMAVTPQIVPKESLTKASGYSQALDSICMLISPAIASLIFSSFSLGQIVFLDVAGMTIAVVTLFFAKIPRLIPQKDEAGEKEKTALKDGILLLLSKPVLAKMVMINVLYTSAMMPVSALFPLMSMGFFGGSSRHASMVEIAFSAGLLLASFYISRRKKIVNRINYILLSLLIMGFSLIFSSVLSKEMFYIFVALAFTMGISGPFYWSVYTPLLQEGFEAKFLGRILSISSAIPFLVAPVGLFASGVVAENYGVQRWFLISGGMILLALLIYILTPSIRKYDEKTAKID